MASILKKLKKLRNPYLAADAIICRGDEILLVERKEPVAGAWTIPGGIVDWGEAVEDATIREVKEETDLEIGLRDILGVYSDPVRDPRGHIISIVFVAEVKGGELKVSREHSDARWFELSRTGSLKMHADHRKILKDFLKWKKQKGTYWSSK